GREIAQPGRAGHLEADRLGVVNKLNAVERESLRRIGRAGRLRERRGQFRMVERSFSAAALRIDDDKLFRAPAKVVAVPETRVLVEPVRRDLGLVDAARSASLPLALVSSLSLNNQSKNHNKRRQRDRSYAH